MKRCILSLLLLTSFNLLAQETTIGLRLGLNASKLSSELGGNMIKSITPINFSIPLNIPIAQGFSLQPEFWVIQKGAKSEYYDDDYFVKLKQKFTYLEVPILGKYTLEIAPKLQASAFFGPSFGYCLAGKVKSIENDGGDISEENTKIDFKKDGVSRVDVALNIGASVLYELGDGSVTFDLRFQPGISNLNKSNSIAVKSRSFIVSFGYIIPIKR